jgi:hypothetical protein
MRKIGPRDQPAAAFASGGGGFPPKDPTESPRNAHSAQTEKTVHNLSVSLRIEQFARDRIQS